MPNQAAIALKEIPATEGISDAPMAGFNDDESSLSDEEEIVQPWVAGFVTSDGTHIPLFVPAH